MVLDDFSLKGRIALVTGAATGLGEAMAVGLAEAGASLALVTRKDPLDSIAVQIRPWSGDYLCLEADLSVPSDRERVVSTVLGRFGRIDVLLNNAGTTIRRPAEAISMEEWSQVLEVNLNAVFHLCQLVGKRMLAQGSGKIINVASLLSFSGGILVAPYAASKGGVAQLTKTLANEWACRGINVNAIVPGYFRTGMGEAIYSDPVRMTQILDRIPVGRVGDPTQLKGAVVFLASAASEYVHGHLLTVDGGWMAR